MPCPLDDITAWPPFHLATPFSGHGMPCPYECARKTMKIPALFFAFVCLAPLAKAQDAPAPLATISNPQITELSGLAASRRYPGLLYAHNDSGDTARVFLLNKSGETVATIQVKGAYARDWEDIAVVGNQVYIGDIGDNLGNRDAVQIYRFAEPQIDPQKLGQSLEVTSQVSAFRYPGAPRDAETLLVAPNGKIEILSKEKSGSSLFGGDFKPGKTSTLMPISARISFGNGASFTRLATAGDFSPDGRKLVALTYTQIYEWQLPAPFDTSKLAQLKPTIRAVPGFRQWESVCYSADGTQIFISSEGENAPLYAYKSAF